MSSPPIGLKRFWTVSVSIWLAVVLSALGATGTLIVMTDEGLEDAVATGLASHVHTQARLAARALEPQPLEVIGRLDGDAAMAVLFDQLAALSAEADAHDLALFDPTGKARVSVRGWVAGAAEGDLVELASLGKPQVGVLYESVDELLFQTAYVEVPGHPGWVLGLEASANLQAIEELEFRQTVAAGVVILVVGALGFGLALLVASPLRRLEQQLGSLTPGDPADGVSVAGPREVRAVGEAVRELLRAIQVRDTAVEQAHQSEVQQLVRLSAEVAHEIRNPLHTLTLSVDRLATLEDPAKRQRTVQRVNEQLEHLEVIVQRLLDLNRPLTPALLDIDLGEVIRAVVDDTALSFAWTGPPSIPVKTDPVLVTEILQNLVRNAAQAGATSLSVVNTTLPSLIRIDVEDDGTGISADDPETLFGWFHTTRAQGSGLGLPTSRRIAHALGGTLRCIGTQPATFRLELPLEER